MEFLDAAKNIVKSNYNGFLNDETLEVIAIAIMAHYALNINLSQERVPGILNTLKIHSSDKSVLEMVYEVTGTEQEVELIEKSGAIVQRLISLDEDAGTFSEARHLYFSTAKDLNIGALDIIHKLIHEFTHLMRHHGITLCGNEMKAVDGISICRMKIDSNSRTRRNFHFEEAIVQQYTIKAMDCLLELIKNEELEEGSFLNEFRREYPRNFVNPYNFETYIIDSLGKNEHFQERVNDSFYDSSNPSQIALFFNNVMGDSTSFTRFSKDMDSCRSAFAQGNELEGQKLITRINATIDKFHSNYHKK